MDSRQSAGLGTRWHSGHHGGPSAPYHSASSSERISSCERAGDGEMSCVLTGVLLRLGESAARGPGPIPECVGLTAADLECGPPLQPQDKDAEILSVSLPDFSSGPLRLPGGESHPSLLSLPSLFRPSVVVLSLKLLRPYHHITFRIHERKADRVRLGHLVHNMRFMIESSCSLRKKNLLFLSSNKVMTHPLSRVCVCL